MSLTGMVVFNRFLETTFVEMLRENIKLFNAASNGALQLFYGGDNKGDWNTTSMFQPLSNLVRRRDPYGTGAISTVTPSQKSFSDVRVASGTPVYEWTYAQFDWIKMNPAEAGVLWGKQLAEDVFKDYLDVMLGSLYAALSNDAATNILDQTSASPDTLDYKKLALGQQLFGDQMSDIVIWILHSKPMTDLWINALTNTEQLFNYGGVAVMNDPFGRRFLITDNSNFVNTTPNPDVYRVFGLTRGAASVTQNADLRQVDQPKLGQENLIQQYQAEWSFNLRLKGYGWDQGAGGHAPTNAALKINTNWDKYVVSHKDLPGVVIEVN